MNNRRLWIPILALLNLMVATLACKTSDLSNFSLTDRFTLRSNETRTDDQMVVADTIKLESGSRIEGDTTLIGTQVDLNGQITGDAVVIADVLRVGDSAHIEGDLSYCVDNLERSDSARINGQVTRECDKGARESVSGAFQSGVNGWQDSFEARLGSTVAGALFGGLFASLMVAVLPRRLSRVSEAVRRSPATNGGVGCLTLVVAVGLTMVYIFSLLLVLPLFLLPFVLLAWLVLGLLALLGWVALAEPFGRYLMRKMNVRDVPPMVVAAVGGVLLSLVVNIWNVFWFTGWIGFLATTILGAVGLGAVVTTRLGTRLPAPDRRTQA